MDYHPPPAFMSRTDRKRIGEAIRQVFPKLTEKQLTDVIEAVGSNPDRCLQHILDHPQRYLLCDDVKEDRTAPPVPTGAPDSTSSLRGEEQAKKGEDWKISNSEKTVALEKPSEKDESEGAKPKHKVLTHRQEEQKRREFSDLNNLFADIFSGAHTGSVVFKGSFHGSKGKVLESSQDEAEKEPESGEEDMDLVLARALQAMEDDAYRAMKRVEEEDERLARELERQEREASGERTTEPSRSSASSDDTARRRRLISSQESQEREPTGEEETRDSESSDRGGWRELVRQDSLTERDRRLALQLYNEEMEQEKQKRKRELDDEALAKSMQPDGSASPKKRRIESASTNSGSGELTSDEVIVKLLQEEEDETYRREREKKAKEEEEQSKKLIKELMRQEELEHDEWVRSELAQIDANEKKKTTAKKAKWPGFGFGWGDKERMRAKAPADIRGDQDWKSSRFFPSTSVLEEFLRTCASNSGSVTITNVMKYELVERFEMKWAEFKGKYGYSAAEAQPTLAFHGTRGDLIPSITSRGLLVPGRAPGVDHVTDSGWWGGGIYLSPNPHVAEGYAADGKMLVCSVLMGRIFHCVDRMDGEDCVAGYDSHTSPCGEELVLFEAAQVLPCYLIAFGAEG